MKNKKFERELYRPLEKASREIFNEVRNDTIDTLREEDVSKDRKICRLERKIALLDHLLGKERQKSHDLDVDNFQNEKALKELFAENNNLKSKLKMAYDKLAEYEQADGSRCEGENVKSAEEIIERNWQSVPKVEDVCKVCCDKYLQNVKYKCYTDDEHFKVYVYIGNDLFLDNDVDNAKMCDLYDIERHTGRWSQEQIKDSKSFVKIELACVSDLAIGKRYTCLCGIRYQQRYFVGYYPSCYKTFEYLGGYYPSCYKTFEYLGDNMMWDISVPRDSNNATYSVDDFDVIKEIETHRATNEQLARWVFTNGQWKYKEDSMLYSNYNFNMGEENKEVPQNILVCKWEDKSFVEPTVEYMGL